MKIKILKIENFRSYKDETSIDFTDLTAFVGKNDVGKSTILEVLDIFFNDGDGQIKLDKNDINKISLAEGKEEIKISIVFEDLPNTLVLDSTNETSLESQFLLTVNNNLEIIKRYPKVGKAKVFIKANHPTNPSCNELLRKKSQELKAIIEKHDIVCENKTKNATMRSSIWNHFSPDLRLQEVEIEISPKDDTKSIWERLQNYMPLYSLFQSDRKNSDNDDEVQDPLREAVKQILNDDSLKTRLSEIAKEVESKLREVSVRTLKKINEMNPSIASSLNPEIPTSEDLKWVDVFKKVSISGDENIPINKRGSGIKRLILLNFFRAEVERRKAELNTTNVVYAIEEPETSQHTEHQRILIRAFLDLVSNPNVQVIITTHSANVVKELNFEHLRLIKNENNIRSIESVEENQLPYPSLNEVNFMAFEEVSEEYHNELFGYIESELNQQEFFESVTEKVPYIKIKKDGSRMATTQITLPEYVRHRIHHPENHENPKLSFEQLKRSIELMRNYICAKQRG